MISALFFAVRFAASLAFVDSVEEGADARYHAVLVCPASPRCPDCGPWTLHMIARPEWREGSWISGAICRQADAAE